MIKITTSNQSVAWCNMSTRLPIDGLLFYSGGQQRSLLVGYWISSLYKDFHFLQGTYTNSITHPSSSLIWFSISQTLGLAQATIHKQNSQCFSLTRSCMVFPFHYLKYLNSFCSSASLRELSLKWTLQEMIRSAVKYI